MRSPRRALLPLALAALPSGLPSPRSLRSVFLAALCLLLVAACDDEEGFLGLDTGTLA